MGEGIGTHLAGTRGHLGQVGGDGGEGLRGAGFECADRPRTIAECWGGGGQVSLVEALASGGYSHFLEQGLGHCVGEQG